MSPATLPLVNVRNTSEQMWYFVYLVGGRVLQGGRLIVTFEATGFLNSHQDLMNETENDMQCKSKQEQDYISLDDGDISYPYQTAL